MIIRSRGEYLGRRYGAAAVEFAFLLPLLAFLFALAVDFAQIYYYTTTIMNCARNGALWGCDPVVQSQSPYTSIQQAALADASNLSPQPTVTSTNGTDGSGQPYVEVTVTYPFSSLMSYPGMDNPYTIGRTERMRTIPRIPSFN
jgi:Flp pilus assembly protein TadG